MSKRTRYLLGIGVIAALVLGWQMVAFAALPGSNFEITDGNLKVDGTAPPALDWANVTQTRKADDPPGQNDNSFVEGTKEDTNPPTVGAGGIPPQKSDLTEFGVYLETNAAGRVLNLYWTRVQEPNGTTNMDFEFNQSSTLSANGVTPVRQAGDVLIQYDLSNGGTNPTLWLSRWVATGNKSLCEANNSTPCWGKRVNLTTSGLATGSINTTAIPSGESDGLGALSARTFGEAQVDFNALTGGAGSCTSFGSAYLKSRSSDTFNAALKDFIAPTSLNLPNCGGVTIRKETVPDQATPTTDFGFTKNFVTQPTSANGFTLKDDGIKTFTGVVQGSNYVVDEATIPAGWELSNIDCNVAGHPSTGVTPVIDVAAGTVTFAIDAAADNLDCTYFNTEQKGAILVTKTAKHAASGTGDHPQAGVDFTVDGVTKTTNSLGQACFDGLNFGSHNVTETLPAGYVADGPLTKAVNVDNNSPAGCAGTGTSAPEMVSFSNTPLTDVTVSVDSQVAGGTASEIDCGGTNTASIPAAAPDNGDGSLTVEDLLPTAPDATLTCVITIDP